MSFITLLGIAIGLGMDAFAVSIATGVKLCQVTWKQLLRMTLAFGFFQMIMPILGWWGVHSFSTFFNKVNHWIAFGLLLIVGLHMIWESRQGVDKKWRQGDPTKGWILWTLAIATSIDAFAVGVGFSVLEISIYGPALFIGFVAAVMTVLGLKLGCRFGLALGERMEMIGGIILVGMGIKLLVENL